MIKKIISVIFLLTIVTSAFAQEVSTTTSNLTTGIFEGKYVAHLALAIAAAGCGLAQGKAVASACEGIARNPQAAGNIRTTMIIGLALIEALVIYSLVAAFAI